MAVTISGPPSSRLFLTSHECLHQTSSTSQHTSAFPSQQDTRRLFQGSFTSPSTMKGANKFANHRILHNPPDNPITHTLKALVDGDNVLTSEEACKTKNTRSTLHKWIGSFQKRVKQRSIDGTVYGNKVLPWILALEGNTIYPKSTQIDMTKSSSSSSFKFVSKVRSITTSITESRTNTVLSHYQSHINSELEISKYSSINNFEEENLTGRSHEPDGGSTHRAFKRRKILEELMETERSYIADIRFLLNVYITMLAAIPCIHLGFRRSVNQNLCEILGLHEELLNEIGRVMLQSDGAESYYFYTTSLTNSMPAGEDNFRNIRIAINPGLEKIAKENNVPDAFAEPQVVVDVSRVFDKRMGCFFIYEEYAAKYEILLEDIALVHDLLPGWEWNQRGLEALSTLLNPPRVSACDPRRAATLKDLLVKPIQRICKYPLIFRELLKYTPSVDCPNAHMAVSRVLERFEDANSEINRMTSDPHMSNTLSRTWLLQDRLVFPNRYFDSVSKSRVKSFGRIRLCGALHVCWQDKSQVDGQYLICLLYDDVLCLAYAGKADPIYVLKACINVHGIKMEETDNGRGLQCHSAPFSWKVVFESSNQLFEMIMTASSSKEELEWRARLSSPSPKPISETAALFTFLDLNITSLGTLASRSGPATERLTVRRATTTCPKQMLHQVILTNTTESRRSNVNKPNPLNIGRSHSILSARARVSFVSPPKTERARLEALLTDVWSREALPFSGLTARSRSDRFGSSSASSVIKKLSSMSIANSLVKKTEVLRQRLSLEDTLRPVAEVPLKKDLQWSCATYEDSGKGGSIPTFQPFIRAARASWSQGERKCCSNGLADTNAAQKLGGSFSRKSERPNIGL